MPQTLPFLEPACVMAQTLKGYTSRDANRLLRRTGEPFWQAESYDHWVRDGRELERIRDNIENKPREPGLVARPADYPDQRQKAEMNLGSAGWPSWQPAPR